MSHFLSVLYVENINDTLNSGRGVWQIICPFIYQSDILKREITIEVGFLTDYASVPRLPFTYWFLGDTAHKASIIHDWLYHHHEICDEQTANDVFFEAMGLEGIPWWRRKLLYAGVAIGGNSSWEEDGKGNGHTIVNGRIV